MTSLTCNEKSKRKNFHLLPNCTCCNYNLKNLLINPIEACLGTFFGICTANCVTTCFGVLNPQKNNVCFSQAVINTDYSIILTTNTTAILYLKFLQISSSPFGGLLTIPNTGISFNTDNNGQVNVDISSNNYKLVNACVTGRFSIENTGMITINSITFLLTIISPNGLNENLCFPPISNTTPPNNGIYTFSLNICNPSLILNENVIISLGVQFNLTSPIGGEMITLTPDPTIVLDLCFKKINLCKC